MEGKTYSIEINGYEVAWFEAEYKLEAYDLFNSLVRSVDYKQKDISLINVATETELGHRYVEHVAA